MTTCEIRLSGCDDSTRFRMDLGDAEIALLQRVAASSDAASDHSCQPRMTITPDPADEEDEF